MVLGRGMAAVAAETKEPGAAEQVRQWAQAFLREADRIEPLAWAVDLLTVSSGAPTRRSAAVHALLDERVGSPTDSRLD